MNAYIAIAIWRFAYIDINGFIVQHVVIAHMHYHSPFFVCQHATPWTSSSVPWPNQTLLRYGWSSYPELKAKYGSSSQMKMARSEACKLYLVRTSIQKWIKLVLLGENVL